MKKIPTLFKRVFDGHEIVETTPQVIRGMEWVLRGEGYATVKMDGACCAIIDGKFYKRYDAKQGKTPPAGAIPCCQPDPVTCHHPHWVLVDEKNPGDRWFLAAYKNSGALADGTYEAIGRHFQSNPYHMNDDMLEPHGVRIITGLDRSYDGIKRYLQDHNVEGIVFWKDNQPRCKIKRSDFGLEWNTKKQQWYDEKGQKNGNRE